MDSINGFPLPPGSTGRVEDIEKGFTSLAGLWGLKLGCAPPIDRFLEKKNALRRRILSWNGSSVPLTLYFELGACLSLSLPPVSISCQVCSLPRYSHSNCNCVTNNNSTSSCISGSSAVPRNGSKIYGDINFPTGIPNNHQVSGLSFIT